MVNPSQPKTVRDYSPTIAKLLATENVRIEHGNFETAFFDLENRVLGLPMWTDMSKSTYDMMVGHEVGHALYTPRDAWKTDQNNCPRMYLNIVEDIRIERLIQATYPGLTRQFRAGYADLQQRDLFGLKGRDPQTLGIADRVNLRAKLGDAIAVSFSPAEQRVVNACFSASTWKEVVKAAKALAKLDAKQKTQEKNEESSGETPDNSEPSENQAPSIENQEAEAQEGGDEPTSSSEAPAGQETNESEQNSNSSSAEEQSDKTGSATNKPAPSTSPSGDNESSNQIGAGAGNNTPEPETQKNFDEAIRKMIDRSPATLSTIFLSELSREECLSRVNTYKKVFRSRDSFRHYKQLKESLTPDRIANSVEFVKETKKFASILRKQFELRKSAYQYVRAKQSKSGELDMGKLHNYKTSDDIFLSVTNLADAKNHGMVMFIDYSDSMNHVITYVLKHVVNLVYFCKMTGIPFEVYGFTSDSGLTGQEKKPGSANTLDLSSANVFELINSEMPKADFNRALSDILLAISSGNVCLSYFESMQATPLHETAVIAHHVVNRFKERHRRQKNIVIFLTDGEPNPSSVRGGSENSERYTHAIDNSRNKYSHQRTLTGRFEMPLCGKVVKSNGNEILDALIKNLRVTTGCTTLGFFIPSGMSSIRSTLRWKYGKYETPNDIMKVINRDKVAVFDSHLGYDKFFIVSSGENLDVNDDEFEIRPNMSKSSIATAFKKFTSSKKSSRVFVTQFANAIS